jgi:hypothetical protein
MKCEELFSTIGLLRYNGIDALSIKGWLERASHDGAPNREVGPPLPLLGALAGLAGLPGTKGGNRI